MSGTKIFLSIYHPPVLVIPLPLIPFTTQKITGCTNEAAKGANKAVRNPPSCFFAFLWPCQITFYFIVKQRQIRNLRKILKYFNETRTSLSNVLLSAGVFPIIVVIYSKDLLVVVLL